MSTRWCEPMPRRRDLRIALAVVLLLPATARAEPARGGTLFDAGDLGGNRKEPITIVSDTLESDYKWSVVEGGRKRVKAVLYPGKDGDLTPGGSPAARGDGSAAAKDEGDAPHGATEDTTAKAAPP